MAVRMHPEYTRVCVARAVLCYSHILQYSLHYCSYLMVWWYCKRRTYPVIIQISYGPTTKHINTTLISWLSMWNHPIGNENKTWNPWFCTCEHSMRYKIALEVPDSCVWSAMWFICLTLTMLAKVLVAKTYKITFFSVGIFWCYKEIH